MNILTYDEIMYNIVNGKLIEEYVSLKDQVQPHGFDLTVNTIFTIDSPAYISLESERTIPATHKPLPFNDDRGWKLMPGTYIIETTEIITLPADIFALSYTRSTILRAGAFLTSAVWDAGFRGRGQFLLRVNYHRGITIEHLARVAQIVFFRLDTPTSMPYNGRYKMR